VVSNVYYDPNLNDTFVYTDPAKNSESKWWGGEPVGNTKAFRGNAVVLNVSFRFGSLWSNKDVKLRHACGPDLKPKY
jgi:hypothetical protein